MILVYPYFQLTKNDDSPVEFSNSRPIFEKIVFVDNHGLQTLKTVALLTEDDEEIVISYDHYMPVFDNQTSFSHAKKHLMIVNKLSQDITDTD